MPPGAILSFVDELGVTKATTTIEIKRFEQCIRRYLETSVPRLMLILDPILVVIENLPDDLLEMIELPFSKEPEFGVCTSSTLLLEPMSSSISRTAKDYFKETDLLIRCILFHSPKRSTSTGPTFVKKLAKSFFGSHPARQLDY